MTNNTQLRDLLRTLRPSQWTKNLVVLAAFFFAFGDPAQTMELFSDSLLILGAALLFCVISSGVYIINDITDIEADRSHPIKKNRPIPAGRVTLPTARCMALSLLCAGSLGSYLLSPAFALVVVCYVAIQLLYSFALKKIVLLDILVIAGGFVLRAIAGAVALKVDISPWLLLCTFLLALFLALCKRRHERILLDDALHQHRPVLEKYNKQILDLLIAIVSSATIVVYAIYTLAPETVDKFGTAKLGFTIPFVIFGIFRYLYLAYRHDKGDRPEIILLTDIPILINLLLYALSVITIFLLYP